MKVYSHNIRDWAFDKHKVVDDKPYGGGAGMLMKIEPIYRAIVANSLYKINVSKTGLKKAKSQRIILLSAKGERFTQQKARELAKYKQIMLICGRYEGVDERVAEYMADEEISIGEYVLTGGEVPALVILDAVARLKKGVLGNEESLVEESFAQGEEGEAAPAAREARGGAEYAQYTRPEVFCPKKGVEWRVPQVLLSGDHKAIKEWRRYK